MTQQQYDPEGRAQLYKTPADKKTANPRMPDLKIKFVLNGTPYEAGLWMATEDDRVTARTDPNGNRFYTGTVAVDTYAQQKAQGQQAPPQASPPIPEPDEGESIPF